MSVICWICNKNIADSGEHIVQASDLRRLQKYPGQPLFLHTQKKPNHKIQGVKSNILKFDKVICQFCNNSRTQLHDYAWNTFKKFLESEGFCAGNKIKLNRPFPYKTKEHAIKLQLFFVKKIGCAIAEHSVPICLKSFSHSILQQKCHKNIYLGFGTRPNNVSGKTALYVSDLDTYIENNTCALAEWSVTYEKFTVYVMYIEYRKNNPLTRILWNPAYNTNRTIMLNSDDFI